MPQSVGVWRGGDAAVSGAAPGRKPVPLHRVPTHPGRIQDVRAGRRREDQTDHQGYRGNRHHQIDYHRYRGNRHGQTDHQGYRVNQRHQTDHRGSR